jgi:hypothetical protein
LLAAVRVGVEDSLWNAIRALDEAQLLLTHIAEHVSRSHNLADAEQLHDRAAEARRQSEVVRELVTERSAVPAERR